MRFIRERDESLTPHISYNCHNADLWEFYWQLRRGRCLRTEIENDPKMQGVWFLNALILQGVADSIGVRKEAITLRDSLRCELNKMQKKFDNYYREINKLAKKADEYCEGKKGITR